MIDHFKLPTNHNLLEPEPEEEQEEQHPVVVDVVYNTYTEQKGKTIALKVSLQLPLKS